jgi:hypothetical protein
MIALTRGEISAEQTEKNSASKRKFNVFFSFIFHSNKYIVKPASKRCLQEKEENFGIIVRAPLRVTNEGGSD